MIKKAYLNESGSGTEHKEIEFYDGDYEIIFSEDFNVYNNKLTIKNLFETTFTFTFIKSEGQEITVQKTVTKDNEINLQFTNFNSNALGTCTSEIIGIGTMESKSLFFSAHVENVSETSKFLKISLTFYLK